MDMIGSNPTLDLNDEKWRIYARHTARAPQYVGADGVTVCEGASVIDSVIMEDVTIGEGATVEYSIIDARVKIGKGTKIGGPKGGEIAVIGADITVAENAQIEPGAMINPE